MAETHDTQTHIWDDNSYSIGEQVGLLRAMMAAPVQDRVRLITSYGALRALVVQTDQASAMVDGLDRVCQSEGCQAVLLRQTQEENRRLRQWLSDLQSGLYVNCVYCGYRYGPDPGTPVAMDEVLRRHIEVCPEHPMSGLKRALDRLLEGIEQAAAGPCP